MRLIVKFLLVAMMLRPHLVPKRLIRGLASAGSLSLLMALMGCLSMEACADIYMFTDDGGTPSFSNVPTDPRYVLTIRTEPSEQAKSSAGGVSHMQQKRLMPEIKRAAHAYRLDPALLHALIATESGFDVRALSNKGAMGLMQLMPATARQYGADDPFDASQNIWAGTRHLSDLLQRFDNDLPLALAAYNSGAGNVVKYGTRIPPFAETRAYVPKVMSLYKRYQQKIR